MRGVFLDSDTVSQNDLDMSALTDIPGIDWTFYGISTTEQAVERTRGCELVVLNKIRVDEAFLSEATSIRLIVVAATGTNNIDLNATARAGITVCNVRGYGTPSVVQHVYALILALTTRLPQYMTAIAEGAWQSHPHFCYFNFPIRELDGKILGIVGYGTLGKGVADAARAFGLEVRICQRPGGAPIAGRIALHELLPQVDILSLHCPLTPATRDLIGAREFALMRNDALLINVARGGIVVEDALVEALQQGQIGGAGVDVLSEEPPKDGNVLLRADLPNLIVTPHIAWASIESRQRVIDIVARNVRAFLDGAPENLVTS